MKTRPYTYALSAVFALSLVGCNGPTKAGNEARDEARARIDEFSAGFTFDQARGEFASGQLERALGTISGAIEAQPDVAEFHLLQGRIYLELNDLHQAAESLLAATELDPELADAHYYAGVVFQRWSDDYEAFERYRRAYEIDSTDEHFLLATAEAMIALGELDGARSFVEASLDTFEHNSALRHLLGQIALLEGDAEEAARLYADALLLDADNDPLLEELAWVQYDAGQYGDAYESVTLLQSRLREKRTDLSHLEARCLTLLGRSNDAYALYVHLTQQDSSNDSLWIEFGTLAWKLEDFRNVALCSVRSINLAPDRFEGYMLKGLYERHQGRVGEAVDQLRRSADLATATVLPHLLLGRTLEEAGRSREALTAYGEALEIDPQNRDARMLYTALAESMHVATAEE